MTPWFRIRAALPALLLLLAAAPAWAEQVDPAGRWALRAGGTTLMTLDLRRTGDGWQGRMTRPEDFQISSGPIPTMRVGDPGTVSEAVHGQAAEGELMLRVIDADGDETSWRLRIQGEGAELSLAEPGGAIAPLRLVKASPGEQVPADIAAGSRHVLPVDLSTNAEMTAIFEADQADRRPAAGRPIDWDAVAPRDEARRARTMELLNAGALKSGDDFRHAAFVFQHGGTPESYLLAHTLATIAAARGRPDATWIAAATLDRYLQSIDRPQIYGTQYSNRGAGWTQEPYDRALVSDALRAALGVPGQAAQAARVQEMEAQRRAAAGED